MIKKNLLKLLACTISLFFLTLCLPSMASVSIEQMFKQPLIENMVLRPDGKKLLSINNQHDKQSISLKQLPNGPEQVIFTPSEYSTQKSNIGQIIWLDNRYFAIQFIESKAGIADLIDTKITRRLLIIDTLAKSGSLEQVLSVKTSGWLVDPLATKDGQFLYAKSGMQSRIYKLNISALKPDKAPLSKSDKIDGGQFIADNQINQVDGYATHWFSRNNQIKAALHFSAPYVLSLTEFEDGKQNLVFSWKLLEEDKKKKASNKDNSPLENYLPISAGPDESEYFCFDRKEVESKSLYLVNFKTKTTKLLYETSAFKIVDLITSPDNQLIGVQILQNEHIKIEYLSPDINSLPSKNQNKLILTIGKSIDLNSQLIYEESFNQPGQFWLETQKPKQHILVGEKYPWLTNQLTSKQIENSVEVKNLNIPYLLNLPVNSKNNKFPLIVMPHGGPIGIFDSPYFDTLTQFFNSQGFAVLRVNFRGSGGRNAELREAGKREWGGLMLTDIQSATEAVTSRSDLDKSRVCLFGMSYGGYAASMLLIKHPEIYKCAIAVAGVYDINLYLQSPQLSKQQQKWSNEYIGNFYTDYDSLKAISPIFLSKDLQKPLLLLHGDADKVVDFEQSTRMKLSLELASKPFFFQELEGLGHGFENQQEAEKLLTPSLKFLQSNL